MTPPPATPGALEGKLIIEIAERPAGEQTGKLLADFGAEVIKVERPGGAPTRGMGPFKDGKSAVFGYFNTNKKSVTLDLTHSADRATLDRLLARAHVLIDDHDEAWGQARRLDQAAVAAAHPHLVHCAITAFGQGAPQEWQKAYPINVINAGGWAYHSPSEAPDEQPPLKGAGRFLPDYESAIDAATCVLASLHRQHGSGQGQFIDISEIETQLNRIDGVLDRMVAGDVEPSADRTAYDQGGPATSFACKDGHIYIYMTTKGHWNALVELMGSPQWAKEFPEDWLEFHCTDDRVVAFREGFQNWITHQEKMPITTAAQKAGIPMVPVNTAADLPINEQLVYRGYFQELDGIKYPTAGYMMSGTPVRVRSHAPALGANNAEIEGAGNADA